MRNAFPIAAAVAAEVALVVVAAVVVLTVFAEPYAGYLVGERRQSYDVAVRR